MGTGTDPLELAMWGSSCVSWLVSIAIIAVGATVIRQANSRAGMIVAGVGVVDLLVGCCNTASDQIVQRVGEMSAEGSAAVGALQTLGSMADDVVLWGGFAAAAFVMARALRSARAGVAS